MAEMPSRSRNLRLEFLLIIFALLVVATTAARHTPKQSVTPSPTPPVQRSPSNYYMLGLALLLGLTVGIGFPYSLEITRRYQAINDPLSREELEETEPLQLQKPLSDLCVFNCLGNRFYFLVDAWYFISW